ncbi:kanadaptin-like [Ctenocephalides felis]|uniref:kanadaptin-like n=1 Tax=Ctenocephalides felis TaxID=7515 RepID=UPI000E6E174B|nr:kanadaptin-like [Ctenocephalides felis]
MESAETEFKKPTLIGKVGKLPRKLKPVDEQINRPQPQKIVEIEPEAKVEDKNVEVVVEPKQVNADPLKPVTNSYKEPKWSQIPDETDKFHLEVIKSGVILETKSLNQKAYWTFGRLPDCDYILAHPTISRYHAVLQFHPTTEDNRPKGWYIYDQNSTHGTFLNKTRLLPCRYVHVKPGFILKFGASTRTYILGGDGDDYTENEMTITDMINKKQELIQKHEELVKKSEEQGIDWGMGEDADENTDLTENPFAATNNEELFLDDPKKTLRGFFEREGLDLVYNVEDKGAAHFTCKIELPVDNSHGQPIVCEYTHHGKKKEAVVQCALEACRILDRLGVLRQSNHEPRKRKTNSDSEEDDFLDRTGDVERKRLKKTLDNKRTATHEELVNEEKEILKQIQDLQSKLSRDSQKSVTKSTDDADALDNFMSGLRDSKMDSLTKRKTMFEIKQLQENLKQVQKLIKISAPNKLPELQPETVSAPQKADKKSFLPLFGKRPGFKKKLEARKVIVEPSWKMDTGDDDEPENDEENQDDPENIQKTDGIEKSNLEAPEDKTNQHKSPKKQIQVKPNPESLSNDHNKIPETSLDAIEDKSMVKDQQKSPKKHIQVTTNPEGLNHPNKIQKFSSTEDKSIDEHPGQPQNLNKIQKSSSTTTEDKSIDTDHPKNSNKIQKIASTTTKDKSIDEHPPGHPKNQNKIQKISFIPNYDKTINESFTNDDKSINESFTNDDKSINESFTNDDKSINSIKKSISSKKQNRNRFRNRIKDERADDNSETIEQLGEKYNTWVPPKNQTGDGRTELNDKFGY